VNLFKKATVKTVEQALEGAGLKREAVQLRLGGRSGPASAAKSLGTQAGAIVRSEVYLVGEQPVLLLFGGDNECKPDNLPRVFNMDGGAVRPCGREETMAATGFEPGGVPPLPKAMAMPLPVAIDAGLKRFPTLYAPAGHPHWVFPVTVDELKRLTQGIVSYNLTARTDLQGQLQRSGWRAPQA
jgi:prolyl-tRNA editing enzyme YbaK/EbsC (Cys-tRNA(Pro) deacylase)